MEKREPFNYIVIRPYLRNRLNRIMQRIDRLNTAKLNYSIQELQSLDVLNDDNIEENQRVLEDVNDFLNFVEDLNGLKESNAKDPRIKFGVYLEKRDVDEPIKIDLHDSKGKIFSMADMSFKANKYTKWICEEAINSITHDKGQKENASLRRVINRLKLIYNKVNTEKGKKVSADDEIKVLSQDVKGEQYKGWNDNFTYSLENEQKVLESLYSELKPIWDLENVLYEIKTQLNKQLLRCLIQDNYTTFQKWGFERDEKGSWVLNFDPKEVVERYSYHVPDLGRIASKKLGEQIRNSKSLKYVGRFTRNIRKNSLDRIINGDSFIIGYKERFVSLLSRIDLEKIKEEQYEELQELYVMGKFMTEGSFERLSEEYPELSHNCELLKQILSPKNVSKNNNVILDELRKSTQYEEEVRDQIEQNLATYKTIFVQYGSNLDKNASVYALRKHMRDKFGIVDIKVVEINAGEEKNAKERGLVVDAGNLVGNFNLNPNFLGTKIINANASRAQKSACGVLSQYGIYVPPKIVQYADTVIDGQIALNSRHGLTLGRTLKNKKLFDFAEAKREDGTYLMETELTDEELESWQLYEQYKKRQEEMQEAVKQIKENIYTIDANGEEKYIAIVNKHINCGAMISYGLGCDYYLSIASKHADFGNPMENFFETNKSIPKATFAMTSNPQKGNGKLPESIIKWCEQLRDVGENDMLKIITVGPANGNSRPFIKSTNDMVVFGGLKTPNLFVTVKDDIEHDDIADIIMYEITDRIGAITTRPDKKREIVEKSIANWENIRARTLVEAILQGQITLTSVQNAGQELLSKEGRKESERTSS